jgi:adenylate cyclase
MVKEKLKFDCLIIIINLESDRTSLQVKDELKEFRQKKVTLFKEGRERELKASSVDDRELVG